MDKMTKKSKLITMAETKLFFDRLLALRMLFTKCEEYKTMDREPSILEAKILRCLGCLKLSIKGALESEQFTKRSLLQSEYLCEFREMN